MNILLITSDQQRADCNGVENSDIRLEGGDVLIAMGIGVAWVYSLVATLAPGIFPAAFRTADGAVAVYFEAAVDISATVTQRRNLIHRALWRFVVCT